eukprot:TRINITY_DN17590_c0_g1_i1.p1 TRINITY_DN17590_c0_g1~~TRINITY_DN17590_c0_g1_i1.p1  ORF type:complete len:467 (+),score=96.10 TRINITY_DN17590_c0_g1_i1:27-1403(+)
MLQRWHSGGTGAGVAARVRLAHGVAAKEEEARVLGQLRSGECSPFELESRLAGQPDHLRRAVAVRRAFLGETVAQDALAHLPFEHYDYSRVHGTCCENVVGYVPVPVGVAGPLVVDNEPHYVPLATTEGALVASTNRGCRAIRDSPAGGVTTALLRDGMTRAPVLELRNVSEAAALRTWLAAPENFEQLRKAFLATSEFAHLQTVTCTVSGRLAFVKFRAFTGDAMGMNMISHGVQESVAIIKKAFPEMRVLGLSGNLCCDKKAAAVNLVEGRGKYVVSEAVISRDVCKRVLKADPQVMTRLHVAKNYIGSALAGTVAGNNAHAANMVAAIYLACGQDIAQVVVSSNCITQLELCEKDGGLRISCTMPSLELGTVGGGTNLLPQAACLAIAGVKQPGAVKAKASSDPSSPDYAACSRKFARIVCATVLAGELSLMAALSSGHLVSSHLRLNRAKPPQR